MPQTNMDTPKGIHRVWTLPDTGLGALWDSIILKEEIKSQLLSQAVLNFTIRGKIDRGVLPLHGVILLRVSHFLAQLLCDSFGFKPLFYYLQGIMPWRYISYRTMQALPFLMSKTFYPPLKRRCNKLLLYLLSLPVSFFLIFFYIKAKETLYIIEFIS